MTGWPKPQILWIRDSNRPLPVGRSYYLGGGALVVTGLMDQDEGGYICEASNAAGPPLRSSTLLQLTEPVSIVKSPKDARVEEGARVSMSCEARGRPPPQQYWVFNGNAVSNDTHVIITGTLVMMDDGCPTTTTPKGTGSHNDDWRFFFVWGMICRSAINHHQRHETSRRNLPVLRVQFAEQSGWRGGHSGSGAPIQSRFFRLFHFVVVVVVPDGLFGRRRG